MLKRGIAFILRLFGRGHWNPLLRALSNLGRPSPVFFPPELLDQGLCLALTGLTNTFAFQSHASWALPWWAERAGAPGLSLLHPHRGERPDREPDAPELEHSGLAGSPWKAMVDPCGMLTPKAFGPSWMPTVTLDGRTWIPSRLEATQVEQGTPRWLAESCGHSLQDS